MENKTQKLCSREMQSQRLHYDSAQRQFPTIQIDHVKIGNGIERELSLNDFASYKWFLLYYFFSSFRFYTHVFPDVGSGASTALGFITNPFSRNLIS